MNLSQHFFQFHIEEHPDYVCPYDWLRVDLSNGSFQTLCGDKKPARIKTNTNWLRVTFHTDKDESNKGFRIRYSLDSEYTEGITVSLVLNLRSKGICHFVDRSFYFILTHNRFPSSTSLVLSPKDQQNLNENLCF